MSLSDGRLFTLSENGTEVSVPCLGGAEILVIVARLGSGTEPSTPCPASPWSTKYFMQSIHLVGDDGVAL